jgi:hypothetical protein
MKIVKLVDELSDYEIENLNRNRPLDVSIEQLIYAYRDGGYDGSGVAVYLDNKGDWHLDEISHCSCNGALDEGFNKIGYTKEQVIMLLEKNANESWRAEDYKLVLAELKKANETA